METATYSLLQLPVELHYYCINGLLRSRSSNIINIVAGSFRGTPPTSLYPVLNMYGRAGVDITIDLIDIHLTRQGVSALRTRVQSPVNTTTTVRIPLGHANLLSSA